MTKQNSAEHRHFANSAIACFSYFALALLLLHLLRLDYAPATTWISGYAVGPYGWLMTTAWLAASGGCLMLLLGLTRSGPRSVAARIGRIVLGILAFGLLITAIFPPDKRGEESISGAIHSNIFLLNVVCILLSSVFLSVGFGSDTRWRGFRRTATMLASLLVLAFALQFLTVYLGKYFGLANRFFAALLIIWLLTISIRLRTLSQTAAH